MDDFSTFNSDVLTEWFSDLVSLWHETGPIAPNHFSSPKELFQWIHYQNYILWHLEDDARREDLPPEEIVGIKRSIDKHNQERNDGIERLDHYLDEKLRENSLNAEDAEINSETPGSIVDRLSILSLKIFHMDEQIERRHVSKQHRAQAKARKEILMEQQSDLGKAFDKLIQDLKEGKKRHKLYRQFKMYNDPNLNPSLYNQKQNK